jgi:hypothetical protein
VAAAPHPGLDVRAPGFLRRAAAGATPGGGAGAVPAEAAAAEAAEGARSGDTGGGGGTVLALARVGGALEVGSAKYCSPRHRMPYRSINNGSKCVSMMWQAISGRPYLELYSLPGCERVWAAEGLAEGAGVLAPPGSKGLGTNAKQTKDGGSGWAWHILTPPRHPTHLEPLLLESNCIT